jgi:hypothetical protein
MYIDSREGEVSSTPKLTLLYTGTPMVQMGADFTQGLKRPERECDRVNTKIRWLILFIIIFVLLYFLLLILQELQEQL